MFKNLFSGFPKIGRCRDVIINPITIPNNQLQTSIFQQNMGEIPPLDFAMLQPKIQINDNTDTSFNYDYQKGVRAIPDTKDFYIGEGSVD